MSVGSSRVRDSVDGAGATATAYGDDFHEASEYEDDESLEISPPRKKQP